MTMDRDRDQKYKVAQHQHLEDSRENRLASRVHIHYFLGVVMFTNYFSVCS